MTFIFDFAVFLFFLIYFLNELFSTETVFQLKWCERHLIESELKMSSDRRAGLSITAALALLESSPSAFAQQFPP